MQEFSTKILLTRHVLDRYAGTMRLLLPFKPTRMKAHLSRFLLGKREIGADGLRAEHAGFAVQPGLQRHEVAPHFPDTGTQREMAVVGRHRLQVARLHLRRDARRLKLAEHRPAAYLVEQNGLYAAVEHVYPSLELRLRMPDAHHLVAVFIKLHPQTGCIVRCTSETLVSGLVQPGILNLLHSHTCIDLAATKLKT